MSFFVEVWITLYLGNREYDKKDNEIGRNIYIKKKKDGNSAFIPIICLMISIKWMLLYILITKLDNSTISLKDVINYSRFKKYVITRVKVYIILIARWKEIYHVFK